MCGIVGILGGRPVAIQVVDALKRLEYRGYDSAGIATLENGRLERRRAEGKLRNLERGSHKRRCRARSASATRAGRRMAANETNAHPHATDRLAVVHNGIIENFRELKDELQAEGVAFRDRDGHRGRRASRHARRCAKGARPVRRRRRRRCRGCEGAFALVFLFDGRRRPPDRRAPAARRSPSATATARCISARTRWRSRPSPTASPISRTATGSC